MIALYNAILGNKAASLEHSYEIKILTAHKTYSNISFLFCVRKIGFYDKHKDYVYVYIVRDQITILLNLSIL